MLVAGPIVGSIMEVVDTLDHSLRPSVWLLSELPMPAPPAEFLADLRRSGETGINLSAVCPDGIWSPMLEDKLDDPDAAPSFSGQLLSPAHVADRTVALLDRPRVVLTIPRWRGAFVRLFDAMPGLAVRLTPMVMADARRRQARWKKRIEAGKAPH